MNEEFYVNLGRELEQFKQQMQVFHQRLIVLESAQQGESTNEPTNQ